MHSTTTRVLTPRSLLPAFPSIRRRAALAELPRGDGSMEWSNLAGVTFETYGGWTKSISHRFEAMVETIACWDLQENHHSRAC